MKVFARTAALMLVLPGVAGAASVETLQQFANLVAGIFKDATVDLIALALVVFFWGGMVRIFRQGKIEKGKVREYLMWGVIVIFFAVSIWGIVRLLQNTLFGEGVDPTNGSTAGGAIGTNSCTSLNCSSPFGSF